VPLLYFGGENCSICCERFCWTCLSSVFSIAFCISVVEGVVSSLTLFSFVSVDSVGGCLGVVGCVVV